MADSQDWWSNDPVITPVYGPPPKPPEPKSPVFVPPKATRVLNPNTGEITPIPPESMDPEAAQKAAAAKQSAEESADSLLQGVKRARAIVSNWSTGVGGAVLGHIPGTEAAQLDTIINQEIRGNIFLNKINTLRQENDSPNGGTGIGRIMQAEIPLITGSIGSLDPAKMGRQGTLDSLTEIEARTLRTKAILNGENPDDPAVIKKYNIPELPKYAPGATPPASGPGPGSGGGSGPPVPPSIGELSGDQKAAYAAFVAANPKPDGPTLKTFLEKLTGKTVTNADDIAKAIAKGRGYNTTTEDLTQQQKVQQQIANENKLGLGENPLTTVAKQGATLNLSDEAAGIGNAASNVLTSPFTGKFDPVGAYTLGRDTERQRVVDARNALGWAAAPVEFVGGMASASPTNALAALGIPELIQAGAKGGAVGGGIAGFGSGEGARQSVAGAAGGAVGGAVVGAVAPWAVGKISANNAMRGLAPDAADAAQAEGVDLLRPMVDPASRGKFGALESAPGSQNVIRAGVDKTKGQIEGRVADLGQGGAALEPGAAGERLQLSGNRYIERSRGIKNRLYSAAENAGGATRLVPQKAIDQADQEIANLNTNPQTNAAEIRFLQGIRDDLAAPGGKTVAEIRNIRTGLRGAIGTNNLTMSGAEARANSILTAAADDISTAVPAAGRLYKRADAFYRERQTVVDDIKRAILGGKNDPLDPQKAFQNIKTLSAPGGNLRRLSAVTRYLEPDERADVAATVASTLGRKAQDAPFSSDLFLSQTDKMSPGALRTLFGPDGAQSISNLRLLSQKLKEGVGDINRSKTANSMWRLMANRFVGSLTGLGGMGGLAEGGLHGGAAGMATGAAVGAAVKGIGMARNILSARAMVNPRVSQWLAQAADVSTPSQAKQAVKGLSLVISREPALAHELTPIRDFLDQRVTQLLAAEPAPDNGNDQQR